MAILIRGMQMPKSCMECPLSYRGMRCLIPGNWKDRYNCPEDERSDACPLVEIPKGARLIDANKISSDMDDMKVEGEVFVTAVNAVKLIANDAPTIFEEDEE